VYATLLDLQNEVSVQLRTLLSIEYYRSIRQIGRIDRNRRYLNILTLNIILILLITTMINDLYHIAKGI